MPYARHYFLPTFMSHTLKKIDPTTVELTMTVTPAEYASHLTRAAERISEQVAIKGFRKGKTPYDIIKKEVGEMAILQEAMKTVVQDTFFEAVAAEKLETIGMPEIKVEKLAPGNDIVFSATVALIPTISLPDLSKISVQRSEKPVEDSEVDKTVDALRSMQAVEVAKDGAAVGTDKLVIDMDMFLDNVPVDGGTARDYQVYLSEDHYIPGFNKELEGLKAGDEKSFTLSFPDTHYQKMLAGKTVDFKVAVKNVFERQLPELSDELAKKLGQDSVEKLRELIRTNIGEEQKRKAESQLEVDIFEKLIAATTFDPIPDVIIDAERQKMFYELTRDLERHGVSIEQYLSDIKKTEKELFEDFRAQAVQRAKAALLSRQIAKEHGLSATPADIDEEIRTMKEVYKDNKEYMDRLNKREVRDTIATMVQNRKVLAWLKEKVVEPKK